MTKRQNINNSRRDITTEGTDNKKVLQTIVGQ